jgi:hypothetical protein
MIMASWIRIVAAIPFVLALAAGSASAQPKAASPTITVYKTPT